MTPQPTQPSPVSFTFFGSSVFSIHVLDELERAGMIPRVVVTTPDKPQGRALVLTPNPVKTWALQRSIPVHDPALLGAEVIDTLRTYATDVFVVASYGKILPQAIIDIPPRKTLNIHPSLLPQYRGASPLQSAILNDTTHTGVTIMRIDEKMDHGPLVAQERVTITEWPTYEVFEQDMARIGARLLARILPEWIAGSIPELPQDHTLATFTQKFTKIDGLVDLSSPDTYRLFRTIQAFHEWPQAYFMCRHEGRDIRVKITKASYVHNTLTIETVIPEGSREMKYTDFKRGYMSI